MPGLTVRLIPLVTRAPSKLYGAKGKDPGRVKPRLILISRGIFPL